MPTITLVKSNEYKMSFLDIGKEAKGTSEEVLVTENLGEDIAFTLYDFKNKGMCLARNVAIEEITTIVEQMLAKHTDLAKDMPVPFFVQFVGGKLPQNSSLESGDIADEKTIITTKAYKYYEQILAKLGE